MKSSPTSDFNHLHKNDLINQLRNKPTPLSPYFIQLSKTKKNKSLLFKNKSSNKNQKQDKSYKMKKLNFGSLNYQSQKSLNNQQILNNICNKNKFKSHKRKCPSNMQLKLCYLIRKPFLTIDPTNISPNNQTIDHHNKTTQQLCKKKYKQQFFNQINYSNYANKQTVQVVSKRCHTDINGKQILKQQNKFNEPKKVEIVITAKKFRKGKYSPTNLSLTSKKFCKITSKRCELSKSNNHTELAKKQSNRSINKDNDLATQTQMTNFYSQLKDRQKQTKLEKSIRQYFGQEGAYKVPKTNNGIEIFLNTVKTPQINRQFNVGTLYTPKHQIIPFGEKLSNKEIKPLVYDFDFHEEQPSMMRKTENQNTSNLKSVDYREQKFLELQRLKAHKQYCHKLTNHIE